MIKQVEEELARTCLVSSFWQERDRKCQVCLVADSSLARTCRVSTQTHRKPVIHALRNIRHIDTTCFYTCSSTRNFIKLCKKYFPN